LDPGLAGVGSRWATSRLGLTPGLVRARPELFAEAATLRLELPSRSAAQIADILWHRHGNPGGRAHLRAQLRRRGLHREALTAEAKCSAGMRRSDPTPAGSPTWWSTRGCPTAGGGVGAGRLFVVVDDHSRLLVHGRFHVAENARAGQEVLRPRSCAEDSPTSSTPTTGHRSPTPPWPHLRGARRPPGPLQAVLARREGKQERLNRMIRERFIAEAEYVGIEDFSELNDRLRRGPSRSPTVVSTPRPTRRRSTAGRPADLPGLPTRPAGRGVSVVSDAAGDPHRTVSLEGNAYSVDPALSANVLSCVSIRGLASIEVFCQGRSAGIVAPFVIGRHTHPPSPKPPALSRGDRVDYLGLVAAATKPRWSGRSASPEPTWSTPAPIARRAARGVPMTRAAWVSHFGLARTPFSKSIPPKTSSAGCAPPERGRHRTSMRATRLWCDPAEEVFGGMDLENGVRANPKCDTQAARVIGTPRAARRRDRRRCRPCGFGEADRPDISASWAAATSPGSPPRSPRDRAGGLGTAGWV